ncbi:putative Calcium/calmodulin-dependent protein kinase type 1 [Blattamonas nauphoetae]|uniref:Calcium/calmodulin-dependent protein kinase type 1 n=1 Tax=Blattamonas nauphoetae TaxID=2049346 RepID=A0ABQ9XCQ9_9EUKA|nr:putative Calcium/calmodulin-dependent protein kinase type 1 [Blattamonas nauphoetae]
MSFTRLLPKCPTNLTSKYELLETIGEGQFAKVKKARNKITGKLVAVKILDKTQIVNNVHEMKSLYSEITILMKLRHPHIIRISDVFELSDRICIVMEYAEGGELFDRIVEVGAYSERDTSLLLRSLFTAIKYMHDRGVAHRDLKPENILYESNSPNSSIKVSDFGLSRIVTGKAGMQTICGTPTYVAPEVLSGENYDQLVDCWSLGVLMYILLCGFPPFYDDNEAILFDKIKTGKFRFPSPYWDGVSNAAKDLISHLLVVDPAKRYTVTQALSHPWFSVALPTHKLSSAHEQLVKRPRSRWRVAGLVTLFGIRT